MTFIVAACEFPDRADLATGMWRRLAVELGQSPVDLLVLPELAGVDSFWSSPTFDEAVWRQAAAAHETLEEHLRPIAAKRIVGTRAVAEAQSDGTRPSYGRRSEGWFAAGPRRCCRSRKAAGKKPGSTAARNTPKPCAMASSASAKWCAPNSW